MVPAASETNQPSSTLFVYGPVHEWVRRNFQLASLLVARDNIRYAIDNGGLGLSGGLDECVTVASDLAGRSSTDAVVADQMKKFSNIAATCSSMATAAASGDGPALATGRSELESELDDLKEIVTAFEDLMEFGDSNGPIETTPTS
jgi:hypothetical protein